MCGIFGILLSHPIKINRKSVEDAFSRISYRGPDESKLLSFGDRVFLGFHRLAVRGLHDGMQPLSKNGAYLLCNGEVYNYGHLKAKYNMITTTGSDCEIILLLYLFFGRGRNAISRICTELDAEFCFILYDEQYDCFFVGRDFGIRPLFMCPFEDGYALASEAKALFPLNNQDIAQFPARSFGVFYPNAVPDIQTYWYLPYVTVPLEPLDVILSSIKSALTKSVFDRLVSDRPLGFFLSGGLDSSLVVAIAAQKLNPCDMKTFSVGEKDCPDLIAARKVAQYFGTQHTEVIFTPNKDFSLVPDIVYFTETFDPTTIRASTPQYFLARYISQNTDVKVLLSGEGSDELAMGYAMWHLAPSLLDAKSASFTLCTELCFFDCLRVDRTTARWGLEVRVPFLAKEVVELFLSLDPALRVPTSAFSPSKKIEKALLRRAFEGYLPPEILWRTKAAFSDAVGHSWVDGIKQKVNEIISDEEYEEFLQCPTKITPCTPETKEEMYYRKIFECYYGGMGQVIPHFWRQWWSTSTDPSARSLPCYQQA